MRTTRLGSILFVGAIGIFACGRPEQRRDADSDTDTNSNSNSNSNSKTATLRSAFTTTEGCPGPTQVRLGLPAECSNWFDSTLWMDLEQMLTLLEDDLYACRERGSEQLAAMIAQQIPPMPNPLTPESCVDRKDFIQSLINCLEAVKNEDGMTAEGQARVDRALRPLRVEVAKACPSYDCEVTCIDNTGKRLAVISKSPVYRKSELLAICQTEVIDAFPNRRVLDEAATTATIQCKLTERPVR